MCTYVIRTLFELNLTRKTAFIFIYLIIRYFYNIKLGLVRLEKRFFKCHRFVKSNSKFIVVNHRCDIFEKKV